jgi:uroporphyrin-III C-methyltransferase / precorrin-2 dehydrogenase / sirohydrochlorin ferrochelatase
VSEDFESPQPMQGLARLPVFFDLNGKRALVAGGSAGAAWKAELLQAAGAQVDVFSAEPGAEMRALTARVTTIKLIPRDWQDADFAGATLAIGDVDTPEDAARFRDAAHRAGVPVNVVDKPAYCDFQFGTIIDRSPLIAAIATAGAAPVFALALRGRFEALLPPSLKDWARAAQSWRPKISDPRVQRRFWELFVTRALSTRTPTEADFEELRRAAEDEATKPKGVITVIRVSSADPELLTLKALRLLQAGEIVFYDAALPAQIIDMARRESTRIAYRTATEAVANIIDAAQSGTRVVWLTRGDLPKTAVAALKSAGLIIEVAAYVEGAR